MEPQDPDDAQREVRVLARAITLEYLTSSQGLSPCSVCGDRDYHQWQPQFILPERRSVQWWCPAGHRALVTDTAALESE